MKKNNDDPNVWMTTKRIETLVDGIFAISMTLLVLSINVPQITGSITNAVILETLYNMSHQFYTYALSFILLAAFWRINHSQFYYIKKTNQTNLWINIIFLLFVALVPFSTNFIGDYGNLQVPMIFFHFNLFLIGILFYLNWYYAYRKNFLDEGLDKKSIDSIKSLNLALPSFAIIAMALTFISPAWSSMIYFGIFFMKRFKRS